MWKDVVPQAQLLQVLLYRVSQALASIGWKIRVYSDIVVWGDYAGKESVSLEGILDKGLERLWCKNM